MNATTGAPLTPWHYDYKTCAQGIQYRPVAGNAILFYSLTPAGTLDPLSMHGSCDTQGPRQGAKGWGAAKWEKRAANQWIWSKAQVPERGRAAALARWETVVDPGSGRRYEYQESTGRARPLPRAAALPAGGGGGGAAGGGGLLSGLGSLLGL